MVRIRHLHIIVTSLNASLIILFLLCCVCIMLCMYCYVCITVTLCCYRTDALTKVGVAGIRNFSTVKCLHCHYSHYLCFPEHNNLIGQWVHEALQLMLQDCHAKEGIKLLQQQELLLRNVLLFIDNHNSRSLTDVREHLEIEIIQRNTEITLPTTTAAATTTATTSSTEAAAATTIGIIDR